MVTTRAPRKTVEEADEFEIREFQPRDLVGGYDGQLYVVNNTDTTVRFDTGTQNLRLEQAGKDGSIQSLPIDLARTPGFQKWWRQGKITVTNDPAREVDLEAYSDAAIELERLQQTKVNGLIHQPKATQAPITGKFAIAGIQQPDEVR
jgi:hypothetical protein